MRSMTGYGKGVAESDNRKCTIELKSVNHRFLDLSFKMPKVFSCFEDSMRKALAKSLTRGHIDIFVTYETAAGEDKNLIFNEAVAGQYVEIAKRIEIVYGLTNDLTTYNLMKCPFVIDAGVSTEDEEALKSLLLTALESAINNLVEMRIKEGEILRNNFLNMLEVIRSITSSIQIKAPDVAAEYKNNLKKRIEEYLVDVNYDESRLLGEVAVYGDRVCIDEEITRLFGHIDHMKHLFDKNSPIGREADFLVQELNRESNTIASKSNNIEVTDYALQLKSIIEKMREQVQNIE